MTPFFLVPNDLLLAVYRKSVEQKLDREYIEILFSEIKYRNLSLSGHPRLKDNDNNALYEMWNKIFGCC